MSYGYSIGDFITLAQLAHDTYRNCKKAGPEYIEIARETRSLRSVLKILRTESKSPESTVFRQDPAVATELLSNIRGCRGVLNEIGDMLAKYKALDPDNEATGTGKKLWQKIRFGAKVEELGAIRQKLITYTSTLSVLLDMMQFNATGQLGVQIEKGFADMKNDFEAMRAEIRTTIIHEKCKHRPESVLSLSSLTTHDGDNKEIWRKFRRELIGKGFRSKTLDRHRDILVAYMMKLERSGILDKAASTVDATDVQQIPCPLNDGRSEAVSSLREVQESEEIPSSISTEHSEPPDNRPPRRPIEYSRSTYEYPSEQSNYLFTSSNRPRRSSRYDEEQVSNDWEDTNDWEDKLRRAASYQEEVTGSLVATLTAETLRKHDERNSRRSVKTRTTTSHSEVDRDSVTIEIKGGSAIISFNGVNIECDDGAKLNIQKSRTLMPQSIVSFESETGVNISTEKKGGSRTIVDKITPLVEETITPRRKYLASGSGGGSDVESTSGDSEDAENDERLAQEGVYRNR